MEHKQEITLEKPLYHRFDSPHQLCPTTAKQDLKHNLCSTHSHQDITFHDTLGEFKRHSQSPSYVHFIHQLRSISISMPFPRAQIGNRNKANQHYISLLPGPKYSKYFNHLGKDQHSTMSNPIHHFSPTHAHPKHTLANRFKTDWKLQ